MQLWRCKHNPENTIKNKKEAGAEREIKKDWKSYLDINCCFVEEDKAKSHMEN